MNEGVREKYRERLGERDRVEEGEVEDMGTWVEIINRMKAFHS